MSLPSPDLDNRTFNDILADVKRQITRRCPEWTEHNVSDPGVTLMELFAWMTEMMLFQLNQVPEKNYIRFLEMIGVSLEPALPAQTDLRFRLSRAIEDRDGEEGFQRTLKARETVAATVRTENDAAVEFSTDVDLHLVRPHLTYILALPATGGETLAGLRDFEAWRAQYTPPVETDTPQRRIGFPAYSPQPLINDALYFGFDNDVSANVVELELDCVQAAATGLDEDYPAQRWEVWNGTDNRWDALEVTDRTYGFNRPPGQTKNGEPTGRIELIMPPALLPRMLGERKAYWVRVRYSTDPTEMRERGPERRRPSPYSSPPEFLSVTARVTGGTVSASNCATIINKELGQSDATPGQVFNLGSGGILPRRSGETVLLGRQGLPYAEWDAWTEVSDFSESGEEDKHFVLDSYTGDLLFGPSVPQPDGTMQQHGKIPEKDLTVAFTRFRYGGGIEGNVAAEQISILKTAIPYIAEVYNPKRADGGRESEDLERAKMRGRRILRLRDRAVTAEDYEELAQRASSGVGRARCVQPRALHTAGDDGERIPPGIVKVLLVPALGEAVTVPRPADLGVPERVRREVEAYLDERRLLTSVLEVGEPAYLYVSTEITLVADPKADPDQVMRSVRASLERYIHPLRGGPNQDGWPFRRTLTLADIYQQVQNARGVAFLLDAKIYISALANPNDTLLTAEQLVPLQEGVRLEETQMLCTREHRIRVRPMWEVGMEPASA